MQSVREYCRQLKHEFHLGSVIKTMTMNLTDDNGRAEAHTKRRVNVSTFTSRVRWRTCRCAVGERESRERGETGCAREKLWTCPIRGAAVPLLFTPVLLWVC